MQVLVAPDKFKGSLDAAEVAARLAAGLRTNPGITCTELPLADGGDGSVAAAVAAGFRPVPVTVPGPTGHLHQATIAFDGQTAVVEVANTCGLALLPGGRLEPMAASSRGFGEAVAAALALSPSRVVLALGGSASTDGGLGLLTALGARVVDADSAVVVPDGGNLHRVERVELPRLPADVAWVVASDVDAVLTGPGGAAAVFGPQKGATPAEVAALDHGLGRLAERLGAAGRAAAATPGAGAAGGLGFAALLLGAELRSGADFFLDLVNFGSQIARADVVVTGEGRIDDQTRQGKLPYVVALRAAPRPTHAVVGRNDISPGSDLTGAFASITSLVELTDADTRTDPELTSQLLTAIGSSLGARFAASRAAI